MTQTPTGAATVATSRRPPLAGFGREIHTRVSQLQAHLGRSSTATATLAHLRNSVGKEPGSVPAIWELTVAGLPGAVRGDDPTPQERAAHAALTLYAVHQQSRTEPMHQPGAGFGEAVRRLADRDAAAAVRRRFDAAATAASFDEATYHLRGLINQLRSAQIPIDYGQLAEDLLRFQRPGGAEIVRRRWGRQYYRSGRPQQADVEPSPTHPTEENQ